MQHGVENNIISDIECTKDLPDSDMDEKGSIDVSFVETWEMGSFPI